MSLRWSGGVRGCAPQLLPVPSGDMCPCAGTLEKTGHHFGNVTFAINFLLDVI